ncbi:MAG: hypothetical protein ACRC6T_15355 [Sarcina sp.]
MKSLKSLFKVTKLFCSRKYVDLIDISNSYTKVSSNYNNSFLNEMHNYNEEMLDNLITKYNGSSKEIRVLDLACGTGFNSNYINGKLNVSKFTLVDISRVLKENGSLAVIVNLKSTLSEVRKIYPRIIMNHSEKVEKIMLELPNPISESSFNRWFSSEKLNRIHSKSGGHRFEFKSTDELVNWVTSTGALAGFDIMVDMEDKDVQKTMAELFKKKNISSITHKFVWGTYRNEK